MSYLAIAIYADICRSFRFAQKKTDKREYFNATCSHFILRCLHFFVVVILLLLLHVICIYLLLFIRYMHKWPNSMMHTHSASKTFNLISTHFSCNASLSVLNECMNSTNIGSNRHRKHSILYIFKWTTGNFCYSVSFWRLFKQK